MHQTNAHPKENKLPTMKVMKTTPSLYWAAAMALSLLLQTAAANNGSIRISDTLLDDEEFSMESETSRRIILGKGQTIVPKAIAPQLPFCDAKVYFNCIKRPNKVDTNRQCNHNTCTRDAR